MLRVKKALSWEEFKREQIKLKNMGLLEEDDEPWSSDDVCRVIGVPLQLPSLLARVCYASFFVAFGGDFFFCTTMSPL